MQAIVLQKTTLGHRRLSATQPIVLSAVWFFTRVAEILLCALRYRCRCFLSSTGTSIAQQHEGRRNPCPACTRQISEYSHRHWKRREAARDLGQTLLHIRIQSPTFFSCHEMFSHINHHGNRHVSSATVSGVGPHDQSILTQLFRNSGRSHSTGTSHHILEGQRSD